MSAAALEVEGVSVDLGGRRIVDDVAFSVPAGSVVALVGPNGAGKSTLLRGMAGALPAPGGRVVLDGVDLTALGRRERARRVALVEQDARSEFSLSVRQAVELGRTPHRSLWGFEGPGDPDAVSQAMKRAEADEFEGRSVGALSGGEQQRVHLARALAQEPQLLMLDEPTNHLDVRAQLRTLSLLRDLAATGTTVLAALHDLNLAAAYCDHVVVLAGGRVAAAGEVAAVLVPEVIEETYGVVADVLTHPRTGRPLIAFSPRP
ncbi:MAG: heme ABC transporter ATP-binding protein [Nocardioides sp.]|uniref:heme ABC transporter ATP-binding protein n=1 Tax=Nocardioides sp. TaxID=35761 RepID=UPI003F0E0E69